MANFNGSNYAKTIAVPSQKVSPGEVNGRIKWLYESYTCTQDVYAIGDKILGPKLPEGAKVVDALVHSDSLGTVGILDLGWEASVDLDGNTLAADPNGLISGADAGGAAVHKAMSTEAGFMQSFGQATQVEAIFTEASDGADTDTIQFAVAYVID